MKEYTLNQREIAAAKRVGALRRQQIIELGISGRYGIEGTEQELVKWDIDSTGGEIAAARILNKPLNPAFKNFAGADIGKNIDVKTSRVHRYRLIVRPGDVDGEVDKSNWWYVHVTGSLPTYKVWGAIKVSDAKKVGSWENPNNRGYAWFVRQEDLTKHF